MHKILKPRQSITTDDEADSNQPNDEFANEIASSEDIPYSTPTTISTIPPTNASFELSSSTPSYERFQAMPGVMIICVVVGVVGILLGVGLLLGARRRRKGVPEELSYDDSYVLQRAHARSVEFKQGVLISIPSRARMS